MDQAKNWQHLPNADHIDWVLESLKEDHTLWAEAWSGRHDAARDAAWATAGDAWLAAQTTSSAIAALIVYDNCDQYLAMGYEKLRVYAILSEKPQARLLLPMAYVLEKIKELEFSM
jgi:hypothetical protein